MHATGSRETTHNEVENTSPRPALGNREHGRKDKEQASSSGPKVREQTKNAQEVKRQVLRLELKFFAYGEGGEARCKESSCGHLQPPVCYKYKFGNGCIYGHRCQYRHEEKPSKRSSKESTQKAVAILRQNKVQGCVFQNSDPKKFILRKAGQVRLNAWAGHTVKFSGRTWYEIRIRDRKEPSRGVIQEGEPHEGNPCAPRFEERTPEETSRQEGCARKVAWDLAKKVYKLRAENKATFYSLVETEAAVLVSRRTEDRMLVVDSQGDGTREGPEPACVRAPLLLEWHTRGEKGELMSCRGTVQSAWPEPQVRRQRKYRAAR